MNELPQATRRYRPAAAIGPPVGSICQRLMREVVETGRPIMLDIMDFGEESFVVVRLPLRDKAAR